MITIKIYQAVKTREDLVDVLNDMATIVKTRPCSMSLGTDGEVAWTID